MKLLAENNIIGGTQGARGCDTFKGGGNFGKKYVFAVL